MKRNTFDSRTYLEVAEALKSEFTKPGDLVVLNVEYDGSQKPTLRLDFKSRTAFINSTDISDFIPDSYQSNQFDEYGQPYPNPPYSPESWVEFVETKVAVQIRICMIVGSRNFEYVVSQKTLGPK